MSHLLKIQCRKNHFKELFNLRSSYRILNPVMWQSKKWTTGQCSVSFRHDFSSCLVLSLIPASSEQIQHGTGGRFGRAICKTNSIQCSAFEKLIHATIQGNKLECYSSPNGLLNLTSNNIHVDTYICIYVQCSRKRFYLH